MTRKEELEQQLYNLNTDYNDFGGDTVCLDGNFTTEQLEIILELLKLNKKE